MSAPAAPGSSSDTPGVIAPPPLLFAIFFGAGFLLQLLHPLLIPISLKGVRYRAIGASALLRRNLWIYGLGGIIAPFIGIKLIDLIVHNLLGA